MAVIGELAVNVTANTRGLVLGLKKSQLATNSFVAGLGAGVGVAAVRAVGQLTASVTRLGSSLAGLGVKGLVTGVKLAASAEQATTAFATLLGSERKALALLKDIQGFAERTPFQFNDLRDSAKLLASFGVGTSDIVPTLQALGNTAAATNNRINDLAELYGKAKVQGRLFAEDLNQLTNRGIDVLPVLAAQFGVTKDEVKKLGSEGKIRFENLRNAMVELTGEGGKYAGQTEAQSKTVAGAWSTLKDNVTFSLQSIGTALLEGFNVSTVLQNLTSFVKQYKTVFVDNVINGLGFVAQGIIKIGSLWNGIKAIAFGAGAAFTKAISVVIGGLEFLAEGIVSVINLIPGMELQFDKTLKAMRIGIDALSKDLGQKALVAQVKASTDIGNPVKNFFEKLATPVSEEIGTGVRMLTKVAAKAVAKPEKRRKREEGNVAVLKGTAEAFKLQTNQRSADKKFDKMIAVLEGIHGELRGRGTMPRPSEDMLGLGFVNA